MSSQIYDHLCVWKFPLNSKLLGDKDCLHWILPVKKNDYFSFYLSIAVLLVFLYLIAAYASIRPCVIIICRCPQNIIEISLSRTNCSSKCVFKNARNVTQFVWQPFSIEFQEFVKKQIKYMHHNLRYYETIEQMHLMVVKKIESYVWGKNCIIWTSLIPPPPSSKTTKE